MPDKPLDDNRLPSTVTPPIMPGPINGQQSGLKIHKNHIKAINFRVFLIVGAVFIGIILASLLWYAVQLTSLTADKQKVVVVTIEQGSSPSQIGQLLQDKSVIRSHFAFTLYTRLSGTKDKLQFGTYRLSPGESTPKIVEELVGGRTGHFDITFLPGATLAQNRKVLTDNGFQKDEIDRAFIKTYDSPLFATKPVGSDLEGYIYGETYRFSSGVTVEAILERTFDEYNSVIIKNNLVEGFKAQGLSLYQGITLASIVEREVPNATDQKQVAQVFYTRLHSDMPLGSDVTFIYAASKKGVTASPKLDSPYNTRIHTGLPPGPIATPGLSALEAVASPASGDYVYFLSGDDNVTYFAHTAAEHDANIANHCNVKCSAP
ncbi:MAG: endolytic transglycosylase MltG [Candidatus Saccharibacteria bacterium]